MKKIVVVVIALAILLPAGAFAEEMQKDEMPGMAMDKSMGKMGCPMMGKTQMVGTDEGGVIVLAGNKLMKYDADLNLVKETNVPVPMGPMGCRCPMMGKMMDQAPASVAAETQDKAV